MTFRDESLAELFEEISPITSYNGNLELYFPCSLPAVKDFNLSYWFGEPKYSVEECVERDMSYSAPLYVKVLLYSTDLDQPIVQDIFIEPHQAAVHIIKNEVAAALRRRRSSNNKRICLRRRPH